MNRSLQKGLFMTLMFSSLPFVAFALKPYMPEISAKFVINADTQGEMHLNFTAPKGVSVPGSGWWSSESEGDPLPEGTLMTISVTRSCSSLSESNIPVLTKENVAPGESFDFLDNQSESPLKIGYNYTYYCTASITADGTTEVSTESYAPTKFGVTLDMSSKCELVENEDGSVTVKYTVPTTYTGTELPIPVTSMEIYRLGEYDSSPAKDAKPFQIFENPTLGATVEFTDPTPTANSYNNWYVKAYCDLGDGGKKISGWVGYDVPYGASEVVAEPAGKGMKLSWKAPTVGQNDYYGAKFDPTKTLYKVYRTPAYNTESWILIADNIKETSFVDDAADLTAPIKINYAVVAYNNVGDGSVAYPNNTQSNSQPFIVGPFYSLPFVENVSIDKNTDNIWSAENPNGGDTWSFMKPFKVGNSYSPTATVEGPEGHGVMGINYNDYDYNRAETKNTLTSYAIDFSRAGKPVLTFSYYAIPGNDTQFDVIAIKDGVSEVIRNIKISDGVDIEGFSWTADNWKEVTIDLSEYAGAADFRIAFASWYVSAKHTTMISSVSIIDQAPRPATFIVDGVEYEINDEPAALADDAAKNVTAIKYHGTEATLNVPALVTYDNATYNVAAIGANAFAANDVITEANIKTPVINESAFDGCPALAKVVMDETTAIIGARAFADCPELKRVEFAASPIPAIADDAFTGIHTSCTGTCPSSELTAYKAHKALQGINFDEVTGIDAIRNTFESANVFTLDGVQVLRNADADAVSNLNSGTYVIRANGKARVVIIK